MKSLAEEEWKKVHGSWPTDADFAWPFFRDAFNKGRQSVVTAQRSFYEILRSKLMLSGPVADNILEELDTWMSEIQTPGATDGRIDIDAIRKKLK